jgi:hypothetical protein
MPMSAHYKPNGTPLTDREREVLIILMEECAEVIHAASKLVRFGKENRPEPDGRLNTQVLSEEVGHLRAMLNMTRHIDLIDPAAESIGEQQKINRLRWFMQSNP